LVLNGPIIVGKLMRFEAEGEVVRALVEKFVGSNEICAFVFTDPKIWHDGMWIEHSGLSKSVLELRKGSVDYIMVDEEKPSIQIFPTDGQVININAFPPD
jgi:hypothetical protein